MSSLLDKKKEIEARLQKLKLTYDELSELSIANYHITDGDSSHRVARRNMIEVRKEIQYWENELDAINNELAGANITRTSLRRW